MNGKIKGKIIVNPYKCPGQNIKQAQRLVHEFDRLNVSVQICYDGYLKTAVVGDQLSLDFDDTNFVIFLDKDKYLAQIIQNKGIKMFNPAKQIADCDDKGQTCIALAGSGVNMPKTLFAPVCYHQDLPVLPNLIDRIESELGYPVIVKRAYGSMGNGVYKADDRKSLIDLINQLKTVPHIYQQYLGKNFGTDIRVVVLGGRAVACMKRTNPNDFRSNVGQGGKGEKIELTDPEYKSFIECAERTAKHLKMEYCGVDLLTDDLGNPVVCEVNSNAFFEELEKISGVNVAKLYCEYVLKSLAK